MRFRQPQVSGNFLALDEDGKNDKGIRVPDTTVHPRANFSLLGEGLPGTDAAASCIRSVGSSILKGQAVGPDQHITSAPYIGLQV